MNTKIRERKHKNDLVVDIYAKLIKIMNVLITGATRGIGKQLLLKFLADGCTVWAISKNAFTLTSDEVLTKFVELKKLHPVNLDFTNLPQVSTVCSNLAKQVSEMDIVINNSGLLLNESIENISLDQIENVYRVNVFSPFLIMQHFLPVMGKKNRGHIVNIGSMGGIQGSVKFAGLSIYSSSKMALGGLTECLAEEMKDKNISINCLAIGSVQTEMFSEAFPGFKAQQSPESMADFIYDFSLKAKNFISGKIIPVSVSTP